MRYVVWSAPSRQSGRGWYGSSGIDHCFMMLRAMPWRVSYSRIISQSNHHSPWIEPYQSSLGYLLFLLTFHSQPFVPILSSPPTTAHSEYNVPFLSIPSPYSLTQHLPTSPQNPQLPSIPPQPPPIPHLLPSIPKLLPDQPLKPLNLPRQPLPTSHRIFRKPVL